MSLDNKDAVVLHFPEVQGGQVHDVDRPEVWKIL